MFDIELWMRARDALPAKLKADSGIKRSSFREKLCRHIAGARPHVGTPLYSTQYPNALNCALPSWGPSPKSHMPELVIPLSHGRKAVFQWPSTLSQADVHDIKDSL